MKKIISLAFILLASIVLIPSTLDAVRGGVRGGGRAYFGGRGLGLGYGRFGGYGWRGRGWYGRGYYPGYDYDQNYGYYPRYSGYTYPYYRYRDCDNCPWYSRTDYVRPARTIRPVRTYRVIR